MIWLTIERKRCNGSVGLIAVWVGGLVCFVMTWPLQTFAEDHSERSLANWINDQNTLPGHLILIGEKPGSVIFYLTKDLRKRLILKQVTSLRIDELLHNALPDHGVIIAVTNRALDEAEIERRRIPGVFTEQVGQFQLFREDDNFLSLVQIAWRSEQ